MLQPRTEILVVVGSVIGNTQQGSICNLQGKCSPQPRWRSGTVSLSGGPAELEAIAAAGFSGVEIFESDLLLFNGTIKDVARMAVALGWGFGRTILPLPPNCLTSTVPLPRFN